MGFSTPPPPPPFECRITDAHIATITADKIAAGAITAAKIAREREKDRFALARITSKGSVIRFGDHTTTPLPKKRKPDPFWDQNFKDAYGR